MNKKVIRNDIILAISLLLTACIAFGIFFLCLERGKSVRISCDGKAYGSFPLDAELEKEIVTDSGRNLLIIEDGKAYVKSADCPDGICQKHRPISAVGETIVCLPHRLVIEVE